MVKPFLQALPRELRDQIYIYVLSSPSGIIDLQPWTKEIERSLSILRTCKQIHRECKDIIWLHKGLKLLNNGTSQFYRLLSEKRALASFGRIQIITIDLELLDYDELEWACKAIKPIAAWPLGDKPQSIILKTDYGRPHTVTELRDIIQMHKTGLLYDGRPCITHTLGQHHGRALSFTTGWPRVCPWSKQIWLKEMLLNNNDATGILREVHDTFGGQLWVGDVLCFKDYKQVADSISLDPRNGCVQIHSDYTAK